MTTKHAQQYKHTCIISNIRLSKCNSFQCLFICCTCIILGIEEIVKWGWKMLKRLVLTACGRCGTALICGVKFAIDSNFCEFYTANDRKSWNTANQTVDRRGSEQKSKQTKYFHLVQKNILVLHEKPVKASLSSLHFTSATKPSKTHCIKTYAMPFL